LLEAINSATGIALLIASSNNKKSVNNERAIKWSWPDMRCHLTFETSHNLRLYLTIAGGVQRFWVASLNLKWSFTVYFVGENFILQLTITDGI
jgi:hypothetical protein